MNTYQEIQEDTYQETAWQANQLVAGYHFEKKLLSVFEKTKYTTDLTEVRPQRLYWLRKVHKSPHQLRPIVSCSSGPTQKLSQLCNSYLRDYLQNVPSLVTYSTEVVRVIEQLHIPPEGRKSLILATLDVRALYPSIPHGVGIALALQQAIPTDPPVSPNHSLKSMLKTMLKLILTGNTFQFAGKTFKQIKGIAMGTPVAPTLANLFMGKLESAALNNWSGTQPLIWLRYIDDILTLFPGTEEELQQLLTHLNAQLNTIKFTLESSRHKIDFLDVTLFKGERFYSTGCLDIRPYSKAIDPHSYLHFSSAHPKGNAKGVVRAEVIRTLRRSCSPQIFAQGLTNLTTWFQNRGYPSKLLKDVMAEISFEERQDRLHQGSKKDLPVMTTVMSVRSHPSITNGEIYMLPSLKRNCRSYPWCRGEDHPAREISLSTPGRRWWKQHTPTTSAAELPKNNEHSPLLYQTFLYHSRHPGAYPGCVFRAHSSAS